VADGAGLPTAGGPGGAGLAGGTAVRPPGGGADEPGDGWTELGPAGVDGMELGWTGSGAAAAASAGATGRVGGTAEAAGSWPAGFVGFSLMRRDCLADLRRH